MVTVKCGPKFANWFIIPQRVIISIMGFLAILNAYTMRIALSMAITRIAKAPTHNSSSGTDEHVCIPENLNDEVTFTTDGYDWSEALQGFILSSFYIGYLITHIPGGILAGKFGGKWVLSLGILSTAFFTLITPLAIHTGGAAGLITVRILMGLGEGTTFPALSALLSQWVPAKERSKLGSLVLGGGQVGTILGNVVSGLIMDSYSWDMVFYFFGAIGVLWFIIFTPLCYSSPENHPFIKPREKEYLKREMGSLERKTDLPPTPWLAIMTNAPMIALICAQIGHDWGFYIMVTDLPKYMDNVLRFSIKANGLFTSLPYLAMWIISLASGYLSDVLINKRIFGITMSRKLFTCVAAVGPAFFMIAASYAGCNKTIVVVLFTICMGLMGAFYAGMKLNPLDLSPNYSATLMAITNGIGSITGIITPYLVGVLTPNARLNEWRLVFWIAFGVLVVTSVVYAIWASGEIQSFNEPKGLKEIEAEGGINGTQKPSTQKKSSDVN